MSPVVLPGSHNIFEQLDTLLPRPFVIALINRNNVLSFIRFNKVDYDSSFFNLHAVPFFYTRNTFVIQYF